MTEEEFNALIARRPNLVGAPAPRRRPPAPAAPAPGLVDVSRMPVSMATSTDEAKLNKTEARYLAYLRALRMPWIGIQAITLKLADDTRYTPDFIIINANGELEAHEVKGFFRDDAKVKIKVAARMYPFLRFLLVRADRKSWDITPIKP